jgi:hypothetical protein
MELLKQLLALSEASASIKEGSLYTVTKNFIASAYDQGRINAGHQAGDILRVQKIEDDLVYFLSDIDEDMDGDKNRPVYSTSLQKFKTKVEAMTTESVNESHPGGDMYVEHESGDAVISIDFEDPEEREAHLWVRAVTEAEGKTKMEHFHSWFNDMIAMHGDTELSLMDGIPDDEGMEDGGYAVHLSFPPSEDSFHNEEEE